MRQYAVVYLPDGSLNASAVGPFNSKGKADDVAERIDKADDQRMEENRHPYHAAAQVVLLLTLAEALEDLRGTHA